jgi:hypothetical protein
MEPSTCVNVLKSNPESATAIRRARRAGLPVPAQGRPAGGGGVQEQGRGGGDQGRGNPWLPRNAIREHQRLRGLRDQARRARARRGPVRRGQERAHRFARRPVRQWRRMLRGRGQGGARHLQDRQVREDAADHLGPHECCGSVQGQEGDMRCRLRLLSLTV